MRLYRAYYLEWKQWARTARPSEYFAFGGALVRHVLALIGWAGLYFLLFELAAGSWLVWLALKPEEESTRIIDGSKAPNKAALKQAVAMMRPMLQMYMQTMKQLEQLKQQQQQQQQARKPGDSDVASASSVESSAPPPPPSSSNE